MHVGQFNERLSQEKPKKRVFVLLKPLPWRGNASETQLLPACVKISPKSLIMSHILICAIVSKKAKKTGFCAFETAPLARKRL